MTIADVTRSPHDTGFEQGSLATINAVLRYLLATNPASASALRWAWESGEVQKFAETETPPPRNTRVEATLIPDARQMGYTGDACDTCGSSRMRRNGSCLVCSDCGTTTGCS